MTTVLIALTIVALGVALRPKYQVRSPGNERHGAWVTAEELAAEYYRIYGPGPGSRR